MWPLRSSRQRNRLSKERQEKKEQRRRKRMTTEDLVDGIYGSSIKIVRSACRVLGPHWPKPLGVVKPHGRLGPLRLEPVAGRPRAAYRRGSLPRPFRRLKASGEFILGRASHLDAFSGYHSRPSLPGVALGRTTGTRAGRPTRSSRTRVRSPQLSNAHDGYRPNCLTTF